MTSRARILCFSFLACLLLVTSSACRSQDHATKPATGVAPAASNADVEAAVALLCKTTDITRSKTLGRITGCRNCPEGTDFRDPRYGETWTFSGAMTGHFTSAKDQVLAIDGSGCDSHASNWGGTYVFSMNSGKPRLIRYDRGLHTASCHKFPYADGREFLVCREGWTGQGENDDNVFLVRFDTMGKDAQDLVFRTTDETGTCGDDSGVKVPSTGIKDVKYSTKGSGELAGMTVTATFGQVTCREVNAKRAPRKEMSSVKTYELHFNFDGKEFTIAPESKIALRVFPQNY
jgi:hypothetical protein